jgi:hypothetical protein
MLLDKTTIEINDTESILSFETEGGGSWEAWDRYIAIEGKKAFHIGNVCGTCSFFFERLEGANKTPNPKGIVKSLNSGIKKLDESFVNDLGKIIPNGKYIVTLSEVIPTLTIPSDCNDYFSNEQVRLLGVEPFFGLPHYPRTEYYRSNTFNIDKNTGFYEFIIPTFPHGWLDKERVEEYRNALKNEEKPSIVTMSVLDIKDPADYNEKEDINCHWCLANYLVDGHHKTYAAALEKKPLTMISFLAVEQGVSSEEDINEMLKLM